MNTYTYIERHYGNKINFSLEKKTTSITRTTTTKRESQILEIKMTFIRDYQIVIFYFYL